MVNRNPQRAVRVGQLERALIQFNAEIAEKTARLIAEFHMTAVLPRLVELEMRWYQRLWRLVCWVWKFLRLDRVWGWLRLDRAWNWLRRASAWLWRMLRLDRAWGWLQNKVRRVPEETLPYKVDDRVRTTEKGAALFEGEPKEGVVTKVTKDRVWVRCPGMTVPQEFSRSVWEVVKEEPENEKRREE